MMTSTYAIATVQPLPNQPLHTGPVTDISAEEVAALGLTDDSFQGAEDLEDNVTFARTTNAAGERVCVWRTQA